MMIIFRADGNKTLGTGHVMRCLSIADVLASKGKEIAFITADDNLKDMIETRGYRCEVLGTDYRNMSSEIYALKNTDSYKKAEIIIVDSYFVTEDYFRVLREDLKTVYIDDLANKRFSADLLINYNIFADEDIYRKEANTEDRKNLRLLIGTKYAPLRDDFTNLPDFKVEQMVKNVLILTGGADSLHIGYGLEKYVSEIRSREVRFDDRLKHGLDGARFHFVVGSMSDDYTRMKALQDKYTEIIEIHQNVKDMCSLMRKCDLALSAAGSTLYELCACGVPTITYVLADNQLRIAEGFSKSGTMIYLGDCRKNEDFFAESYKTLSMLSLDSKMRGMMSKKSKELVDGRGAIRIAEEIIELPKC